MDTQTLLADSHITAEYIASFDTKGGISPLLSHCSIMQLEEIAALIRERILEVVSKNGGHLSSTLGAVELIIGMHAVFDHQEDAFIFDVSHQAYAHKLLTGRWGEFETLRRFGGLSGFCNPRESRYDYFIAGHSSTSISLAVGAAKAFKLNNQRRLPVVMIGDGSMSAGLVYEALNELGARKYPMVIILNDNEMSIAKPIGAVSNYLSQILTTPLYQKARDSIKKILSKMPDSATYLAKRFEESLKLITPGILFEELGLDYVGPIDGHNLETIITTLQRAKDMKKPVIIHAQTLKGKGYEIAEGHYEQWHGVGAFDRSTGKTLKKNIGVKSPTEVFASSLQELISDERVVGVTAAMPSGTGLDKLIALAPERFWDVAICEAHGVTSMAAMAKEGYKPFVAIYSTFLQRAYDEIIHDVGILGLPVRFCIDRAGIVGEDGETHQGLFDIAYLRPIPQMLLFAPRDNATLQKAVEFAYSCNHAPCAFRYPRGKFILHDEFEAKPFVLGEAEILKMGEEIALIGYGNGVGRAFEVYNELMNAHLNPTLLDLRFVKPLDTRTLRQILSTHRFVYIFSDSYKIGGVGSAIMEFMADQGICTVRVKSFELDDTFVLHGNCAQVEEALGLEKAHLASEIFKDLSKFKDS